MAEPRQVIPFGDFYARFTGEYTVDGLPLYVITALSLYGERVEGEWALVNDAFVEYFADLGEYGEDFE